MKGNEKILICHLQLITTTRICASRFKCATLLFPFAFNKNIPHLFDSLRSGFYLLLWKHCSYVKAKSATSSFWLSLRVFIWYMVNVCRVLYEREWERREKERRAMEIDAKLWYVMNIFEDVTIATDENCFNAQLEFIWYDFLSWISHHCGYLWQLFSYIWLWEAFTFDAIIINMYARYILSLILHYLSYFSSNYCFSSTKYKSVQKDL